MTLNPGQAKAIKHNRGPCLVLACPGAGKTFVLTKRIEYLVGNLGIAPGNILVITFTKAAASEMRQRYLRSSSPQGVIFGTFHSVFFSILKESKAYSKEVILDTKTKRYLIKNALSAAGIEPRRLFMVADTFENAVSAIKNGKYSLNEYDPAGMTKAQFIRAYNSYEEARRELERIDFDDIILETKELLEKEPEVLERYRRHFRYILVDEAQDMNRVQFETVRLLAAPDNNLFLVGDDDQSIYGFRGADSGILLGFKAVYQESTIIEMAVNYRSEQAIVEASKRLIENNRERYKKEIKCFSDFEGKIEYELLADDVNQAKYVADRIKRTKKMHPERSVAVLYRHHAEAERIKQLLDPGCSQNDGAVKLIMDYFTLATSERWPSESFISVINCPERYLPRGNIGGKYVEIEKWVHSSTSIKGGKKSKQQFISQIKRLSVLPSLPALLFLWNVMGVGKYISEKYGNSYGESLLEKLSAIAKEKPDKTLYLQALSRLIENTTRAEKTPISAFYTFHGSKGLEFDEVYIISANDGIMPARAATTDGEKEEERRMFYVAVTRAKSRLVITAIKKSGKDELYPSPYIRELLECK